MEFVNINGHAIHTSQLSGSSLNTNNSNGTYTMSSPYTTNLSNSLISGGSTASIIIGTSNLGSKSFSVASAEYFIMGENVTIKDCPYDSFQAIAISGINVMGWDYYDQLLKNKVHFSENLKKVLDSMYLTYKRSSKIKDVLKT